MTKAKNGYKRRTAAQREALQKGRIQSLSNRNRNLSDENRHLISMIQDDCDVTIRNALKKKETALVELKKRALYDKKNAYKREKRLREKIEAGNAERTALKMRNGNLEKELRREKRQREEAENKNGVMEKTIEELDGKLENERVKRRKSQNNLRVTRHRKTQLRSNLKSQLEGDRVVNTVLPDGTYNPIMRQSCAELILSCGVAEEKVSKVFQIGTFTPSLSPRLSFLQEAKDSDCMARYINQL